MVGGLPAQVTVYPSLVGRDPALTDVFRLRADITLSLSILDRFDVVPLGRSKSTPFPFYSAQLPSSLTDHLPRR